MMKSAGGGEEWWYCKAWWRRPCSVSELVRSVRPVERGMRNGGASEEWSEKLTGG